MDLEYFKTTDIGSQAGQTLLTTATNSNKQGIASRGLQNTVDTTATCKIVNGVIQHMCTSKYMYMVATFHSMWLYVHVRNLHMLHGIFKKDKIHDGIEFIIGFQCFLQDFLQCLPRGYCHVLGFTNTTSEVTIYQRIYLQSLFINILEVLKLTISLILLHITLLTCLKSCFCDVKFQFLECCHVLCFD